jgi:hypothetical protein
MWLWAVAAAALAGGLFGQVDLLHGDFVYDDGGTITNNDIVTGERNLSDVWIYDFWGEYPLVHPKSHKSWRPLTTLSFHINFVYFGGRDPFGYHIVNVLLHAVVSALVVPAVFLSLDRGAGAAPAKDARDAASWTAVPGFAALLFAAHPIHAEAVQNITGRAEVLMAVFFLAGFIAYASAVLHNQASPPPPAPQGAPGEVSLSPAAVVAWWRARPSIRVWTCGLVPALAMTVAALLSKETGVTLPVICATWDFFVPARLALADMAYLVRAPKTSRDATLLSRLRQWTLRCLCLAAGTLLIVAWRRSLNGGSAPHLRYNQNRIAMPRPPEGADVDGAGSATPPFGSVYEAWFWRGCSIAWLWVEYAWSVISPRLSSADWSCRAIPALGDAYSPGLYDHRLPLLALLTWASIATVVRAVRYAEGCRRPEDRRQQWPQTRPELLMAVLWYIVPFILSSNFFFPIGTTKAERVLYLPSLGWCIFLAHCLVAGHFTDEDKKEPSAARPTPRAQSRRMVGTRGLIFLLTLVAYGRRTLARCREWRSSAEVWEAAYRIGEARGHVTPHTLQNYGFASAWAGQHETAVYLLERFESMSKDELGEQAFNVETSLVLELRLVGRLEDAEARARATVARVLRKRAHRQQMGIVKDESGPWRLQARATAALALCQSHRSLKEAAALMHSATTMKSDDHVTFEIARGLEAAMLELEQFNKAWATIQHRQNGRSGETAQKLEALPYLFRGYEGLPGNTPLLEGVSERNEGAPEVRNLIAAGLGERGLIGGGASGSLSPLLKIFSPLA